MKNATLRFDNLFAVRNWVALATAVTLASTALASSTAFTYQAQLTDNGQAVNRDLASATFTLYTDETGGTLLASQTFNNVPVVDGQLTVALDFGDTPFASYAHWLEVAIEGQPLTPRQSITGTPFALQTRGLAVDASERVGVGVDDPLLQLHVGGRIIVEQGTDLTAGIWFKQNNTPTAYGNSFIGMRDDDHIGLYGAAGIGWGLIMDRLTGFIGLGTTDPQAALHLRHGTTLSEQVVNGGNAVLSGWGFNHAVNGGRLDMNKPTSYLSISPWSDWGAQFRFHHGDAGESDEIFARIGNELTYFKSPVGIGVENPYSGYALDVNGWVRSHALQLTGGSDIAEPFDIPAEDRPAPGMIVVIDEHRPGGLRVATDAYDRKVAGIISGAGGVRPGLILQQDGSIATGAHPVALSGRVYCYVDADAGGPVRPGDLLTTASTPGHAMKVKDYERAQGSVLGKAMSSLAEGRGLVLVLVNLQ